MRTTSLPGLPVVVLLGSLALLHMKAHYSALLIKNCDGTHSDRPELQQAKRLVAAH